MFLIGFLAVVVVYAGGKDVAKIMPLIQDIKGMGCGAAHMESVVDSRHSGPSN